jgi:NADH dehydrogenase FAD-containing subunit
MSALPHVFILGGGFGGLQAARGLARAPVRVTLVDQHNHHLFQPLLYQVATLGRLRFSGFVAWVLWVFVHIFYLIGFRNRFVVLFEWAWLYCTRQRGARVILERRG